MESSQDRSLGGKSVERLREALHEAADALADFVCLSLHESGGEEFLSMKELCERIPFGQTSVRTMIKNGELRENEHFVFRGRTRVFIWSRIVRWLDGGGLDQKNQGRTTGVVPVVQHRLGRIPK